MSAGTASQRPPEDREITYLADVRRRRRPALMQFSLSTLLMVMTLVGVGAGLTVAIPPLGGWFIVVGSLALIRTTVECRRFLRDGREVLLGDKLNSFGGSLGYSFLAVVCTLLVFGFCSFFAMALVGLVQWALEAIGVGDVVAFALPVVGVAFMLAVAGVAGMTFFSVYWQTILPRTTLDPPAPRPTSPFRNDAR